MLTGVAAATDAGPALTPALRAGPIEAGVFALPHVQPVQGLTPALRAGWTPLRHDLPVPVDLPRS